MRIEELPINKIQVSKGLRQDLGDIDSLAESIKQIGLINPITVFFDGYGYHVRAGRRRYLACKKLHLKIVPVRILDESPYQLGYEVDYTHACDICDCPITDEHHMIPSWFDGADIPENKLFLCPTHHKIMDFLTKDHIRSHYKFEEERYRNRPSNAKRWLQFIGKLKTYDPKAYDYFQTQLVPLIDAVVKNVNKHNHKIFQKLKIEHEK